MSGEREILERAVAAHDPREDDPPELLRVKAELEPELERLELDCRACGRLVHSVSGLGVRAGHGRTESPRRTGTGARVGAALVGMLRDASR